MKLNKIIFIVSTLMILFGVLVEASSQNETSTTQTSPTPQFATTNAPLIGVMILGVASVSSLCGLIIIGYNYFKERKGREEDHEIKQRLYSTDDGMDPFSEKFTIMQPSRALTKLHPTRNRGFVGATNGDVTQQFPLPPPNHMYNFDNNQIVSQTLISPASIVKEKKDEFSLTCKQCGVPILGKDDIISKTLSLKHNNNIIYQITANHDNGSSDSTNSTIIRCKTCNLSRTQLFGDHHGEIKKYLDDVPRYNIVPAELYIDKFTIAGQGTIGIKFQAKERFRIVLSSNKVQSYGKANVIVLDVGEDVTYFRKRNNDDPYDVLASTREQKALLDKDINQLYWLSHDKKNRRLRYGKGPMQSLLTVFCYNFPPQSREGTDEYAWIEELRYIAISSITFQKKDFIESKPRIELKFCSLPVTVDLPPFIINHEDATLDELEKGKATVIDNLPEECKDLYWNIVGSKISLNSPDFPDFADAIEYSINTPGLTCYEKLKEKAGGFGGHDLKKTYLRVTLGEDQGNSPGVPYVLEIWPSGHYSPIHSHSNSFGIIKVLYNEIVARYFTELQTKDQEWYYEVSFKEGQVTWISDKYYQTHQLWNRTRKVCATIQCYQYGDKNNDHYEYFDYVDNNNIVRQFKPNTDWPFTEFKKLIRKEWDRYKYLSGEISLIKNCSEGGEISLIKNCLKES